MYIMKNTFLYNILYPVHAVAWIGLALYLCFFDFTWVNALQVFFGWVIIEGLGVAVVLHRLVSHRAVEIRPGLKPILLWISCLSLQGSPLGWAAIHRGSHHRYADTEKDAHSPLHGTLYSWHLWLRDWDKYFNPKYAIDLIRDPMHMWFAKHYNYIIIGTYIVVGLFSWQLLLFGFMIPAAISLYQESNINVFCHRLGFGYRNFDTKDWSRNIPFLAWITWGQGWHNNHHAKAAAYDFGTTTSGNPAEWDMSLIFVPLIATKESRTKIFEGRKNAMANTNS
jgi:stearoyl-CoA desaturase (delta-9 desaturase)